MDASNRQKAMSEDKVRTLKREKDKIAEERLEKKQKADRTLAEEGVQPNIPNATLMSQQPRELLEVASDRANKFGQVGQHRLDIDMLGFHPDNRGGMGVMPPHIHAVAQDCIKNAVSQKRYNVVEVVKVPHEILPWFREASALKCKTDPLMPKFAEKMEYIILTRTHFVHSLKLEKDGDRTLHNKRAGSKIAFPGVEAAQINKFGAKVSEYDPKLLSDPEACKRLMSEHNVTQSALP